MRMIPLPPPLIQILCDQWWDENGKKHGSHLLGAWHEISLAVSLFTRKHRISGYIESNCIEPKAIHRYYKILKDEMQRRNNATNYILPSFDISYLPEWQQNAVIDVNKTLEWVLDRCPECSRRYEALMKYGKID